MWEYIIQTIQDLNRTNRQRKVEFALCIIAELGHQSSLALGASSSQAFRHGLGSTLSALWLSGLQITTISLWKTLTNIRLQWQRMLIFGSLFISGSVVISYHNNNPSTRFIFLGLHYLRYHSYESLIGNESKHFIIQFIQVQIIICETHAISTILLKV